MYLRSVPFQNNQCMVIHLLNSLDARILSHVMSKLKCCMVLYLEMADNRFLSILPV